MATQKTPTVVGELAASEGGDSASFVGSVGVTGTSHGHESADAAAFTGLVVAGYMPKNCTQEEVLRISRHKPKLDALLNKNWPDKKLARGLIALYAVHGDHFPAKGSLLTLKERTDEVNEWLVAHDVRTVSPGTVERALGWRK